MDSYTARLKDDVQCSLCNDTLTEPKILKCFHTFCKPCIKRHAELIEEVNVFKCPECKSKTPLPELNSVEDLKPSALHSRMVKVLEFLESEKVCSVSGSHPPATWHCFDCNRSLCDECEKSHSVFIKDHNLVSLAETREKDIKQMLNREANCVNHVNKLVEWFCKDCKKVICVECLKYGHEGHLTCTLSNYAAARRTILSKKLEQLKQHEQEMETKLMAIRMMNGPFKESCEKAKLEVKETLEKIFEILQKKALGLTNQIDEEMLKAEQMKEEGRSLLNQQQGMITYLNKLLEKGISSEVIDEEDFKGKSEDFFQVQEKDYRGMPLFVTNQELLKQANIGLGILKKLGDTGNLKKFAPASGAWECSTCLLNNKSSDNRCAACHASKPGTGSNSSSSPIKFIFGGAGSLTASEFAPAPGFWNCDSCMIVNHTDALKCLACESPKPGSSSTGCFSTEVAKTGP